MLMERVAGCWWNDWPDVRGTRGRMAWNTHHAREPSAIRFVTPNALHRGDDRELLSNRHKL